jgi:serine/threonine-protein kinase
MPDLDSKRPPRAPSLRPGALAPSQRVGLVLADRYRLERLLGEGAMGAVYLAEHVHMRKRFALKLLHGHATSSPELVARFEREAIAAGHLSHPNIAAASDFGQLPDGAFFLVLEYVDGRSLRDELDAEGALHPRRALGVARQIVSALGAAHAKGIVHRDVKPENVMLVVRGRSGPTSTPFPGAPSIDDPLVKVLDFGIAKLDANATLGADSTAGGTPLTRAGAIYGTPQYMAPEQAAGGEIDHRADFYAVGSVLYEMITGRPPFEGEAMEIIAQMLIDAPAPLSSAVAPALVSPALRALVDELLAKDRVARPANAADVLSRLDAISAEMNAEMSAVRPLPPPPPPPPPTGPIPAIGVAPPGSLRARLAPLAPLATKLQLTLVQSAVVLAAAVLMPLALIAAVALSGPSADESADVAAKPKPKRRAASVASEAPPSASARSTSDKTTGARTVASSKGSASDAGSRPSASPLQRLIGFP